MYFLPLSWDGGVGVERVDRGLMQTPDFSVTVLFFSVMVEGVADMIWAASGVCNL